MAPSRRLRFETPDPGLLSALTRGVYRHALVKKMGVIVGAVCWLLVGIEVIYIEFAFCLKTTTSPRWKKEDEWMKTTWRFTFINLS